MKETIFRYAKSIRVRIISAFLAVLIILAGLPYVGLNITVNAASRAIRFSVTDTNSNYTARMNDNKTATGSNYTYTGKYTQNNKVTLFDYVSDYELANGYNNCKQDESGYMDVYTAFNNAISQSDTSATPLYATDNITINYTPDTTIFDDTDMIYVYLWNNSASAGHQTPWPGIQMTYDYANSRYTCTLHPSLYGFDNTYRPDRIIFNNGKSDDSQRKTGDITQEMSVNNTYTFDNRVIVKFIVSHDKQYISGTTPPKQVQVYLWERDSNGNDITGHNNTWPGQYMTYIENDTYTYNVPSLNFTPNSIRFYIDNNNNWNTKNKPYITWNEGKTYEATYDSKDHCNVNSYYHCSTTSGSQPIYDTIYSTPLYFGDFWLSNDANGYTSSNHPAYNNFFWQANMGLKPHNVDDRGTAAAQGLVYEKLSGDDDENATGDLLDTADGNVTNGVVSGTVLPYFSTDWAKANPSLMKYYNEDTDGNDIVFPFYETHTSLSNATLTANANKDGELARFYQFDSKEANLKFNIGAAAHTGYFEETDVDIIREYWDDNYIYGVNSDRSNVGFYPFNENNDGNKNTHHSDSSLNYSKDTNINEHNLGFGTKLQMNFQLESDGCVSAVKLEDGKLKGVDSATRIHTTFEFEGDDDLWVFIDGNLVLDMGGDHLKANGKIDFADGTATVSKAINFKATGSQTVDAGDDLSAVPENNKVTNIRSLLSGNNTATRYDTNETHTMTVFYMERGMLDSNLLIRFNYSPISNSSKMKIAEATKFDNVNAGLMTLTKKVAEDDVFKYTITNKIPTTGVTAEDPLENGALYPTTDTYTRTAEADSNITTTLTRNGPGDPDKKLFTNGSSGTETPVTNTAYWWVDKFATDDKMVGKTDATNGDLWLMYGTSDQLYGSSKRGVESSAEFENQFTRNSIMKILQGDTIYRLPRSGNTATLFNSTTGNTNATLDSTRTVAKYYDTTYRIVDRAGNTVVRNDTEGADYGTFTFNNRTTECEGVTNPVSEHLAVQLTEYVENTVKTSDLSITKNLTGLTTNPKDTEYKFQLTLTNVFGDSTATVSDYTTIVASKTGEVGEKTGYITNVDSKGQFTLKKGQTITISGIPFGTEYTITEITTGLHQIPVSVDGEVGTAKSFTEGGITVTETVTNNYNDYVDVTVKKTAQGNDSANNLDGAEIELWYKEKASSETKAYTYNDPEVVSNQKTSLQVSKTASQVGVPGLQENTSSYTYYTIEPTYSNPDVPSSEDHDWILPRSDTDYIYFRDYNTGTYPGDHDNQSFSNTTGNRSWLCTTLGNNSYSQTEEINYDHKYWFAAQFSGNNKKTVTYAMWERFVDEYQTGVNTVVWKIQPPDGYSTVRFMMYDGDTCIRTTNAITYKLGKIYHKISWGGQWASRDGKNCYFNVPCVAEDNYWAPYNNDSGIYDQRDSGSKMLQARKYTPTEQKIIFHCDSSKVWHNIHIQFYSDTTGSTLLEGQAFPGYMMEPYAYANSEYRTDDNYLTYELTIPKGAKSFRITNGEPTTETYGYYTKVTELLSQTNKKNYGNYFHFKTYADKDGELEQWSNGPEGLPNYTYSESEVTSDSDYVYFMKETTDTSWGDKVYAYFYGGGNLRDDNWQRACYSAWPGVAPAGTDYQSKDAEGNLTETVHSNTYSIQTIGDNYNGNTSTGTLSPEATFSFSKNSKDYKVYKFRLPQGDRKNYSKVIFNNGLGGGKETDVIEYHAGYMYTKSGAATKHYENKPTVTYTGRTNAEYTGTDKTEYIYIKNTANWDDPHITFYDNSGNQILQGGCGYVMDYAGKIGNVEYYRMPIPNDAAKFSVNNGIGTDATEKYDIIRYSVNSTGNPAKPTSDKTSADKFVYDLSGTALSRIDYSEGTPTPHTESTTTVQTESTANYNPQGTNSGVRQTGGTDDTLNIRDIAGWDVPIGGVNVTFYGSDGGVVGSGIMMKTNADSDGKVWYTKIIPTNAKSFTVSYTKTSGTPATATTTTTPSYPIYSGTEDANGNKTTTGNMYYQTKGTDELSMIYAESTVNTVNDETYTGRGDDLYLKCLKTDKDSYWKDMTVEFKAENGSVIKSGITAKYINDKDGYSWYKVSIPEGAATFTVTGGTTPHTTSPAADIYELKTKISRYQQNYTLGDMQYELPSSTSGKTNADLLYPKFTAVDNYTLTVADGKTISSSGTTPVDASQISGFANASAEPRATTTADSTGTTPVLYNTDSTNITYQWEEDGVGDGMLRFDNSELDWDDVYAEFFNSSGTSLGTATAMVADTSTTTKKITVPENATKVKFSKSGAYDTDGEYTGNTPIDMSGQNNGRNRTYKPVTKTVTVTNENVYAAVCLGPLGEHFHGGQGNIQFKYYNKDGNQLSSFITTNIKKFDWSYGSYNNSDVYYSTDATVPDNAYFVEFAVRHSYTCSNHHNGGDFWAYSGKIRIRTDGSNIATFDYLNQFALIDSYEYVTSSSWDKINITPTDYPAGHAQSTSTIGIDTSNSGTWITNTTSGTFAVSYQPEDRYGMISEQNTNYDSVLGFNDTNNFINVIIPNSITKPYIKFYDSNNDQISSSAANGLLLNVSDMTLNGSDYSMSKSTDTANSTKTYRVRLPKNAVKFAICDGTTTGSKYSLYSSSEHPLTVKASDGQIPSDGFTGNTVELTNFHHAGSSFSVNGSTLAITLTDVRDSYTTVKSEMEDPINPKTDADYVFLTLPSGLSGWTTPYAYYYGAQDGEYSFTQSSSTITWPGIRASGSYTDKNNRTVYRFQIPKTTDGKYGYVMFNSGTYTTDNITEGKALIGGKNYILDSTAAKKDYGASVKAYALTPTAKAPNTTTKDYSLVSYIYIVNNGTQDLTNTTVESSRTTLDEMHVVFYEDAEGANVVRSGSLNGYKDAGYIPDQIGTLSGSTWTALQYNGKDVYRIQVPSTAKYFQINNGYGKGSGTSNYSLRKSEIKAITANGLYQFVQDETEASKYIEGSTSNRVYPTDAETRQNPRYLLTLVQSVNAEESDEDLTTSGTVDVHIATVVTASDGTVDHIKWLKDSLTSIDNNYLANTTSSVSTDKVVKVKKDGDYYWKEVVAPSGYKINNTVTNFSISGYDHTNTTAVPTIVDEANPTGSLTLNKKLYAVGSRTNSGESQSFTFNVTLVAPVGTDWTDYTLTKDSTAMSTSDFTDNGLTRTFSVSVPATGTDVVIGNIPSGTAYSVTETALTDYSSTPVSISEAMYKTENSTTSLVTETVEDMDGTIPSYTDDQSTKNNVKYIVTNKREVGSLTLAKNVTGAATAIEAAGINQNNTYTDFTYTVKLTAPTETPTPVDLRDYLLYATLTDNSGFNATLTKVNNTAVSNTPANDYNNSSTAVISIEFTVAVKANNGSKTIGNLPMGTGYTVIENGANGTGTGWNCSTSGQVSSERTLSTTDPNPVVTITNDYTDTSTPPPSSDAKVILTKTAKEQVGNTKIGDKLGNAKFLLYVNDGDNNDNNDSLAGSFTLSSGEYNYGSGTFNTGTNYLVTGNDSFDTTYFGKLILNGLPVGDYYLQEEVAPNGFSNMDSNTGKKKRVYFSVGDNTVTKNIICSDEMDAAYIRLFEHINEKKEAWGDPTFIFKITNKGTGKTNLVSLTVNDDGTITDTTKHRVLKWIDDTTEKFFTADPINNSYNSWLVEATSETEYKGMYHIDSQGRIRVEPGNYEISRMPVSRYKFVTSGHIVYDTNTTTDPYAYDQGNPNPFATDGTSTVTLSNLAAGQTADVHYYDEVEYYDKFSHVDEAINKFYKLDSDKKNTTIKGIRISDYHTAASGTLNLTGSDLTVYAIYADGTEGELNYTEKAKITFSYTAAEGDTSAFACTSTDNGKTLNVTDVATYNNKVYTITATYDSKFITTFDLVFSRS